MCGALKGKAVSFLNGTVYPDATGKCVVGYRLEFCDNGLEQHGDIMTVVQHEAYALPRNKTYGVVCKVTVYVVADDTGVTLICTRMFRT